MLSKHNDLCRWTQNKCQLEGRGLKAADWHGGWNMNCLQAETTEWVCVVSHTAEGFAFAWMCSACMTPCACSNVTPQTQSLEVSGNIKETDWAKWWSCRANPCGERSLRVTAFNYHCTRKRARITCQHFWAPQTFGCLVIENAQRAVQTEKEKVGKNHSRTQTLSLFLFSVFFWNWGLPFPVARRDKSNIYVHCLCWCCKWP